MYEPGSLIVYGTTGVCRVEAVAPRQLMRGLVKNCYTLHPLYSNDTIYIPVDTTVFMREPITGEQANALIDRIQDQSDAPLPADLSAAKEYYDSALQSHDCGSLLQLIRQIYRKAQRVKENKRQPSQTDQRYLKRAEELLYGELAVALGIEREEVVPYIAKRLGDETPA